MFAFAAPGRYPPAVLFPVISHDLPGWLRPSEDLARAVSMRDASLNGLPPSYLRPVIDICMDDLGEDLAGTDRAMALPQQVAMSFLPYAQTTPFLAQEAAAKGHDILAHVPMEALSSINPGPMTLSVGAPDIAVRAAWNIDRVPGAIGINNHEGSRFSQDAASLAPVAKILAARRLFFFDSRTGPSSKVMVAKRQGAAIAIGHPHDVTLTVLAEWLKQNHGVTLVRLPEAMQRKAQAQMLASR